MMDGLVSFDINESLKQYLSDPSAIETPEADASLVDCENDPDSFSPQLVNSVLNPIIDAVAESPDAICSSASFDSLQFLLKCAPISSFANRRYIPDSDCRLFAVSRYSSILPPTALSKILDIVVSGLSTEAEIIHNEAESNEGDAVQHHKQLLEMYGFLVQWTIAAIETKAAENPASGSTSMARGRGGKGAKSKQTAKDGWDSSAQIQAALDTMSKVLKLRLNRIFQTTSERDTFVSLFTRAVYLVLESETRVKSVAMKMHLFKVLCIAVKHHGHAYGISTSLSFKPQN